MIWLLVGYTFLFIFRPFEYWPALEAYHIERIFMLITLFFLVFYQSKNKLNYVLHYILIVFLLILFFSAIFSNYTSESLSFYFNYLKLVIYFYLIVLIVDDEDKLEIFINSILIITFIYIFKSAWEFFVHGRFWYRMGIVRMVGIDQTYGDPNYFAATIVYSMPFVYMMHQIKTSFKWKSFYLIAYLPLALISLIYTGSRSGQITFMFFLVLVLFISKRKILLSLIVIAMLSIIWIKAPDSYKNRLGSIFDKNLASGMKGAEASAEFRIIGYKQGIKLLKENPLLGIGPGNFPYGWDGSKKGMNAHSLYGQIAGELGLIGILGFTLLVLQTAKNHWKNKNKANILLNNKEFIQNIRLHSDIKLIYFLSICSLQLLILLFFEGLGGHNLYRYHWLWIIAFGIISSNLLTKSYESKKE